MRILSFFETKGPDHWSTANSFEQTCFRCRTAHTDCLVKACTGAGAALDLEALVLDAVPWHA